MKITLLASVAVAALSLAAPQASAADTPAGHGYKPYVSVFGGASLLDDVKSTDIATDPPYSTWATISSNAGYIIGGAVGVQWDEWLRTELELSHSRWSTRGFNFGTGSTGVVDGSISATYLLGNIWFDMPTQSAFKPYFGGGLGVGWANGAMAVGGGSDLYGAGNSGLAFQLGVGVKYGVSEHVDLDVGYRFKEISNITFQHGENPATEYFTGTNLVSHNFQVGLTYKF